jgi:hypothetical protein
VVTPRAKDFRLGDRSRRPRREGSQMYTLRTGLTFCVIDRTAVFLDAPKDRYFALSATVSQHFLDLVDALATGTPIDVSVTRPFVERDILVPSATAAPGLGDPIPLPRRQWRSDPDVAIRPQVRHLFSALGCISQTRARLRTMTFDVAIKAPAVRSRGTSTPAPFAQAVGAFRRVAQLYPVHLDCLPSSLALRSYLAALGWGSDLVIAVSLRPFAAHCWLQIDDMVVGDTLERVEGFIPIRRVA